MPTPKEVAEWMLSQLDANGKLLHVEAVAEVQRLFGPEFVYENSDGEIAIDRQVLYQFRKLTGETVVWVTRQGGGSWPAAHWRRRGVGDSPGRTQYVSWESEEETF